ncbi:MAG TPA: hypothetical protein VGJ32_09965 [Solirubrobacteraceae bacterium]|jgi:hypothetical protein
MGRETYGGCRTAGADDEEALLQAIDDTIAGAHPGLLVRRV